MISKKYSLVFVVAFLFNLVWEYIHSGLYLGYQGGVITRTVLLEAALIDALLVLILVFLADRLRHHTSLFVIMGGLFISTVIEIWALQTGRWQYNELMPIIPIINVGLTPFIQLALTGLLTQKLSGE